MKQTLAYAALGGALGGLLMGLAFFSFTDFDTAAEMFAVPWFKDQRLSLLLPPFIVSGAALGGCCAFILFFGCLELARFSELLQCGFRTYRRPILWLCVAGALTALVLAKGVPISPGLFPIDEKIAVDEKEAAERWKAIKRLQDEALERSELPTAPVQLRFASAFLKRIREIHALLIWFFGATVSGWSALVFATFLVSRRAGSEAAFWSLWLLAGGFSLGIVAIGGFGYAFQAFGPGSSLELYVYSILNAGTPGAWIAFTAAAGNTFFGMFGLGAARQSFLAGLLTFANTFGILVLGTTTRLSIVLSPAVRDDDGIYQPSNPVWHVLTYFEGHMVDPFMTFLPTVPLAALITSIGMGLICGGACYGINLTVAEEQTRHPGSTGRIESEP